MTTRRERLLQKLNPKLLKMTPKLSCDSFIELESEDSLEDGAKKLMMRFFKNQDLCEKNKRNLGLNEMEILISSANYTENEQICELIPERLTYSSIKNEEHDMSEKPGKRLQILKLELQEKMSAKWEEEYKKRVNESKFFEKTHKHRKKSKDYDEDCDKSELEDEEEDPDNFNNDCDDGEDADVECENNEDEVDGTSISSLKKFHKESSRNSSEKSSEFEESESCSLVPAYQPGGGLLYGGSELTQNDEGLPQNLLSPSLRFSMNDSPSSKKSSEFQSFNEPTSRETDATNKEEITFLRSNKLFSQNPDNSFDLSDAFELCSGKFPEAENETECSPQNLNEEKLEAHNDEEDDDENDDTGDDGNDDGIKEEDDDINENSEDEEDDDDDDDDEDEDEDEETESKNAVENLKYKPKIRKNIIAFEDSEEEETEQDNQSNSREKDVLESGSTLPKLLSDDENENEVPLGSEKQKPKKTRTNLHFSDEEDTSNEPEAEADSESEEEDEEKVENCDEKSVHYDSEENEIINPREFFDKEAELSGSEWSGDEDEKGLDEFDAEEGDADNFDNDQVRSQLEKIHIRRVLDDDAREVRLIQEILFEDGDLHGDGKKRDRKFKWKNLGTFGDEANEGESKEEGGNSSEDDCAEEVQLRKIRHEKELFFMSNKKSGDGSSDDEIAEDLQTIKVTRVKESAVVETRINSSKTITNYTEISRNPYLTNARGSFLTRNEEFLSKLAKATSGVSDNVLGPKNSKNFVFAVKSPEKTDSEKSASCKRQIEETTSCARREKKVRLLPPEINTGPSILDLLI